MNKAILFDSKNPSAIHSQKINQPILKNTPQTELLFEKNKKKLKKTFDTQDGISTIS